MANFKAYSRTVFGQGNNIFEGVDQGYDPCAEPIGRVQECRDCEFVNAQMRKRRGWSKKLHYHNVSVLQMAVLTADDSSGIAVQTGQGEVRLVYDI